MSNCIVNLMLSYIYCMVMYLMFTNKAMRFF
jgi:hypothetical protein